MGRNNTGKSTILSAISATLNPFIGKETRFREPLEYEFHKNSLIFTIEVSFENSDKVKFELVSPKKEGRVIEHEPHLVDFQKKEFAKKVGIENAIRNLKNGSLGENGSFGESDENLSPDLKSDDIAQNFSNFMKEFDVFTRESIIGKWFYNKEISIESLLHDSAPKRWPYEDGATFDTKANNIFYRNDSPMVESKIKGIFPVFIDSSYFQSELLFFRNIVESNQLVNVQNILQKKIPDFVQLVEKKNVLYLIFKDLDGGTYTVPYHSMGEGFKTILKTMFFFASKGNVFLMEEPENSLHPGYMNFLAEEITKTISEKQFFITTHSLEFIDEILKCVKKNHLENEIQIIRLRKGLNGSDRQLLEMDGIENELEKLKIDLRGY